MHITSTFFMRNHMISLSILHLWALLIKFSNAFAPKGFHKPFPWRSSLPNRFLGGSGSTSTSIPSCSEVNGTPLNEYKDFSTRDSFNLIVMGDLHLEDDMKSHEEARDDCIDALKQLSLLPSPPVGKNPLERDEINADALINQMKKYPAGDLSETQLEMLLEHKRQGQLMNCHLISLGDLGRKDIRHEPGDAGTTKSFVDAKEFLDSFQVPFDLVTGNHDLEGLDEFDSDEANLQAWMSCFRKDVPYFSKQVGEKTLLVGLSTVRFRDAPHSSHECHVDDEQLEWFRDLVEEHSHYDGWRILVFTHAPIMGSNLRVLQNVHVVNGCAWMNHCSPPSVRSSFIEIVKQSPQIKLWSSGHFHLSHEFEDSLSRVNQCTFMQVGVVGKKSTRDHTRQTRIVQGNSDTLKIYTINHHLRNEDGKADMRLDASIDLVQGEMYLYASKKDVSHSECKNDQWFGAYVPQEEDGCYVESPSGRIASEEDIDEIVCWWHMEDGCVLGVHEGQVVEYDASTLSPLGIVVNRKELKNREVLVVDDSKAIVLVDPETDEIDVIHPNDDGSYWRKYQRNKRVRQEEKARELAAKLWMEKKLKNKST